MQVTRLASFSNMMAITLMALAIAVHAPRARAADDHANKPQVRVLLETGHSWDGTPLQYPSGPPQVTAITIELAPGTDTGWHLHDMPNFAYVIAGELEVRREDGRTKRLRQGDALAEVVGTWHAGRVLGTEPVRLVVFYMGTPGMPLSRPRP